MDAVYGAEISAVTTTVFLSRSCNKLPNSCEKMEAAKIIAIVALLFVATVPQADAQYYYASPYYGSSYYYYPSYAYAFVGKRSAKFRSYNGAMDSGANGAMDQE